MIEIRSPFGFGMSERVRIRITFQKFSAKPLNGESEADYEDRLNGSSTAIGPFVFSQPGEIQRYTETRIEAEAASKFLSRTNWQMFGNLDIVAEVVDGSGKITAVPVTHPMAAFAP